MSKCRLAFDSPFKEGQQTITTTAIHDDDTINEIHKTFPVENDFLRLPHLYAHMQTHATFPFHAQRFRFDFVIRGAHGVFASLVQLRIGNYPISTQPKIAFSHNSLERLLLQFFPH